MNSMSMFGILLAISILVFISSFLAVNNHSGGPTTKDRLSYLLQFRNSNKVIDGNRIDSSKCTIHLNATCQADIIVKYWNDDADCFDSPLRTINGYNQLNPNLRKYVVFQPDLGGWNNIRMALEMVILFAHVTGRILVIPPTAVLYLLVLNKKWGDNRSNMGDYIDFSRLQTANGLEIMSMEKFLAEVAVPGLLSKPLPENNTKLIKQPLWDYLESACTVRQWSPGKIFVGFNITRDTFGQPLIGEISDINSDRFKEAAIGRYLITYDKEFDSQRAIYFPGHDKNRLLTHFYTFMYFADPAVERMSKRFVRDRLRYLDPVFCAGGKAVRYLQSRDHWLPEVNSQTVTRQVPPLKTLELQPLASHDHHSNINSSMDSDDYHPSYIAYHVRRGDFQHKNTQLPAEEILELTAHLIHRRKDRVLYISTDEKNRTFFEPFFREFKMVYFLTDLYDIAGVSSMNQNHIGMMEQVICANAYMFFGTPLSTFTAYITRMRGYFNRTMSPSELNRMPSEQQLIWKRRHNIYSRTYYFMKKQMHQLHEKPHYHLPFWVRDFVDAFKDIDEIV